MLLASPTTRRVLAATAVALACALPLAAAPDAPAASACDAAQATPSDAGKRRVVRATLCVLNAERARRGLRSLRLDRRLSRAARRHATDMVGKGYFSHDSLDGSTFLERIRRTGYLDDTRAWRAGENIAWGSGSRSTPRAIARAWMDSPGHRANILSRSFRDIGIAVVSGAPAAGIDGPAGTYATDFGSRG
ncbi:MAG TPA: CAP domain-containing protein [Thermoleophilaceae bacterium]|nr:CAP domain-containing protein [Thermoleophilaceae bacterium]